MCHINIFLMLLCIDSMVRYKAYSIEPSACKAKPLAVYDYLLLMIRISSNQGPLGEYGILLRQCLALGNVSNKGFNLNVMILVLYRCSISSKIIVRKKNSHCKCGFSVSASVRLSHDQFIFILFVLYFIYVFPYAECLIMTIINHHY